MRRSFSPDERKNGAGFLAWFLIAALFICGNVHAAQVRAWLDRDAMQLGETVTLNVEVADTTNAPQPDFGALQSDFNLLGTQSSSSMNIVNGAATSKLLWAVGLEPKHAGTLTIPALNVAGAQTQPLTLTVTPASTASAKAGDDVFLDVDVEPKSPYVQQQVRVTIKLYYALNLTDGQLDDPHGDGLNAHKLGRDAQYTADVQGRGYHVLERHYTLSAEKSGVAAIAPITFRGHAVDPGDMNSFFARGRMVTARAAATTLDVRPRPASSGTDTWLPAQSLSLTADGIDANTQAHVGEPITLTLRLKAQGLGFEQLPELKLPKIDGADIYPDKETTVDRDDGTWGWGERTRKFAIVPNRTGALTIPALSLSWWDTRNDRAASADLPAQTLTVVAGGAVANASPNAANSTNIQTAPTQPVAPASTQPQPSILGFQPAGQWRMLAIAGFSLWLLTLAAWLVWARMRKRSPDPTPGAASLVALDPVKSGAARKAFTDACKKGDASAIARALIAWARSEGGSARTLGELSASLADEAQRNALDDLERNLYSANMTGFDAARSAAAFRNGFKFIANEKASAAAPLPPLYPFELRKRA
jgi:hypothetical protein